MTAIFIQFIFVSALIITCIGCFTRTKKSVNEIKLPCDAVKCGANSGCLNNGMTALCYCQIGFTGNSSTGCTKLDKDPCDPNPCGPNSVCLQGEYGHVNEKKFGAYCLCEEKFYGSPPKCHHPCHKNDDCGFNEVCEEMNCIDYCNPTVCGDNSACRNGNHSSPHCSCLDSFIPQSTVGCRLKTLKDSEINLKEIQQKLEAPCPSCKSCTDICPKLDEICVNGKCIENPCLNYCGSSSNCAIFNSILECFNAFDNKQNPFMKFDPDFYTNSFDSCDYRAVKPECAVGISEAAVKALAIG